MYERGKAASAKEGSIAAARGARSRDAEELDGVLRVADNARAHVLVQLIAHPSSNVIVPHG